MSAPHTTGLGEPEPIGKKALFQPPAAKALTQPGRDKEPATTTKPKPEQSGNGPQRTPKRVRITTEVTDRALMIIQETQNRYRLKTGRALPLWRAVSEAVEYYGTSQGGKRD